MVIFYLIKYPHLNLAYSVNKFKEITIPAYIEAIINILVSIILVNKIGLVGVGIGTSLAITYMMIFHVRYTKKIIKGKEQSIFYKKLFLIMISTGFAIIICQFFKIKEPTFLHFILGDSIDSLIVLFVYGITALLFFKKELFYMISYLKIRK